MKRKSRAELTADDLLRTPAGQRAIEEERLFAAVRQQLVEHMDKSPLKRRDLAEKLGVTEGRISQVLSGSADNITLKTIAGIGWALDLRFGIHVEEELEPGRAAVLMDPEPEQAAPVRVVDHVDIPQADPQPTGRRYRVRRVPQVA